MEPAPRPGPPAACAPPQPGEIGAGATAVSGTFTAPDFDGTMCSGAAYAIITPTTGPGAAYTLTINGGADPTTGAFLISSPSNVAQAGLFVEVTLPSLSPGSYGANACGAGSFSYEIPSSNVDCAAATRCTTGCVIVHNGFGSPTCEPALVVGNSWAFATATNCPEEMSPGGTWSVTLTSATEVMTDAAADPIVYTPHGTFTATMPDENGTGSLTMSLTF